MRSVQAAVTDARDDGGDREVFGVQVDGGTAFREEPDEGWHRFVRSDREEADAQLNRFSAGGAQDGVHRPLGLRQDGRGFAQERVSDRGQGDSAAAALE